jgi:hypothetical protein
MSAVTTIASCPALGESAIMHSEVSILRGVIWRRPACLAFGALAVLALSIGAAAPSFAVGEPNSQDIDFSASGYTLADQSPVGQNGWSTDTRTAPNYDYALVDDASFPASGLPAGISLRFSNAKLSTTIGQLLSPSVAAAGETGSGAAFNTFSAEYTIASATGAIQPGLSLEVSAGHATNRSGGDLIFRYVDGGLEIGAIWMPSDGTSDAVTSWRSAQIQGPLAGGLWDPSVPHTVSTVIHLLDNATDQTEVAIDGVAAAVIPTWEYYSRLSSPTPKTITNLLFRTTSSAPSADGTGYQTLAASSPTTLGNGFLFSGIHYASSEVASWTPTRPTVAIPAAADSTLLAPGQALDPSTVQNPGGRDFSLDLGTDMANQYVALYAYSTPQFLGWFLTNSAGVVSFTMPSGVAGGVHTIAAYNATGGLSGWVGGITVAAASVAAIVADPELAATGASLLPLLPVGGALILIGAVVLVGTRRRWWASTPR